MSKISMSKMHQVTPGTNVMFVMADSYHQLTLREVRWPKGLKFTEKNIEAMFNSIDQDEEVYLVYAIKGVKQIFIT